MWMKIDPYYQRKKCRPMTLVSGNIRYVRIFAGVRLGRGIKRHWGLSTTAIFDILRLRNLQRYGKQYYMTICYPCRPVTDCKMNDLEWLFHVKVRFGQHFLNQSVWMSKIIQPLRVCGVLFCALHDQLAILSRHAQLTRCFSVVAELLVVCPMHCIGKDSEIVLAIFRDVRCPLSDVRCPMSGKWAWSPLTGKKIRE